MSKVFLDDRLIPEAEAKLPIVKSGLEAGLGVFTVMRVHEGKIEWLEAHIDRLVSHAKALGLTVPDVRKEFFENLVKENGAVHGTYRLKAMLFCDRVEGTRWDKSRLILYVDPYTAYVPEELSLNVVGFDPPPLLAKIKTLSRLERRLLWHKAVESGFDETLMTTREGIILEALWANIFWIHDNRLFTPDPELPYMVGITVKNIERAVKGLGMAVEHVRMSHREIPEDAHLFISNAMIWFCPVVRLEDRRFERDREFEETLRAALKAQIDCGL